MSEWKLPWDGGCRCHQTRIRVSAAAASRVGLPLHGLPNYGRKCLFTDAGCPELRL